MTLEIASVVNQCVNWLKDVPIAHRALHDIDNNVFENTLSAASRAVAAGYSIEVDLQPSCDGVPMVFHDYTLQRMTAETGNIRDLTAEALGQISIKGTRDMIPTLSQLLDCVKGKSGLVLEMKGQLGADNDFVLAIAKSLESYKGPVVIMSFNHWLLEDARAVAPQLLLGLTAKGGDDEYETHRQNAEKYNVDFLSYSIKNLDCRFVRDFRKTARPVISWTIRSPDELARGHKYSDQVTFGRFIA